MAVAKRTSSGSWKMQLVPALIAIFSSNFRIDICVVMQMIYVIVVSFISVTMAENVSSEFDSDFGSRNPDTATTEAFSNMDLRPECVLREQCGGGIPRQLCLLQLRWQANLWPGCSSGQWVGSSWASWNHSMEVESSTWLTPACDGLLHRMSQLLARGMCPTKWFSLRSCSGVWTTSDEAGGIFGPSLPLS